MKKNLVIWFIFRREDIFWVILELIIVAAIATSSYIGKGAHRFVGN